jgi:hypothetical protein
VVLTLLDPTGTSLTIINEDGGEIGHLLYNAFGGVLSENLSPELEAALAGQGALDDPDTGLIHLGNGRWYDPSLGRPLQPNPVGGPPTLPQALNRYAATPLGQPGVAEGASSNGIDLLSPIAWTGLTANVGLEVAGRTVAVQTGRLVLQGTAPALEKTLGGKGLPFAITSKFTKGGLLGDFAVGLAGLFSTRLQHKLADKLFIFEARTLGNAGWIESLGSGRFSFGEFGTTIDTIGLQVTYQRGLLLGEAKGLAYVLSLGATFLIDTSFELYGATTGTGRWANPYWTTQQKVRQAGLVIFSDLAFTGGLLLLTSNPYVVIPVAFLWAIGAEPVIFQNIFPELYQENRNLRPLEN